MLEPTSHAAGTAPHAAAPAFRWIDDSRHAGLVTLLAWLLIVLMIVPEGLNYENLGTSTAPTAGSAISRLLWLGLLGAGALVILWRATLGWVLLRSFNPFFVVFLVLAGLSALWSIETGVTVRRLIRLFAVVGVSAAVVLVAWHPRRFTEIVRPILTFMLFGSLLFGLVAPHLAIHPETSQELAGAWRGLTNHKNTLGALSSITMILWMHALISREAGPVPTLAGLGISTTMLLLSRSSTALVTTVFVVLFLLLVLRAPHMLRRSMPWLVGLFVVALLTYAIAVLRLVPGLDILLKPIVMITGKDLTFTGRSEIWELMNEHIGLRPLLGCGYGAFWIGAVPHSPSYEFVRQLHFYPGSAHNGYLDVVNELGFVGLLCLGGYLLTHMAHALNLLGADRSMGALYLALFFQQAISNLSETHWFSVMNMDFVIVTLATFTLARQRLELRLRHYFGQPYRPWRPAPGMPALARVAA